MSDNYDDNYGEGDDYGDDIARDRFGRPILDRFGRPVRNVRPTKYPVTPRERRQPRETREPRRPQPIQRPEQTRVYDARQQPPRRHYAENPTAGRGERRRTPQAVHAGTAQHTPAHHVPADRTPKKRPAKKKGSILGRIFRRLLAAIMVVVLIIGGTLIWLDTKLIRVDAGTSASFSTGTNWLLVGSDSRAGLSEEDAARLATGGDLGSARTDTIMLVHVPLSGKPTILSIPRDSYVNIPGYGMEKINSAFFFGGPELLTQTVEEATGVKVNHYAEIGLGGFAQLVDAVDGVELCPAEPMYDPLAGLDIPAGCQVMDGATALGYVRTRATAMGDLDRVVRQREFFSAVVHKLSHVNPLYINDLIGVTSYLTVGKHDHSWNLARLAWAMRGGVDTETVPVAGFEDTEVGNVVIWDEGAAQQMFSQF